MDDLFEEMFPEIAKAPDQIVESLQELVNSYVKAIERNSTLAPYLQYHNLDRIDDDKGAIVALFKHYENENSAKMEAAVYLLSQQNQADQSSSSLGLYAVPPTLFIRTKDNSGCLVKYIENSDVVHNLGRNIGASAEEFQKICILDIRFGSPDRHGCNTLVVKGPDKSLHFIAIDFEESFGNDYTFRHLWWTVESQAGDAFSMRMKNYVETLNADEDINVLKNCGWEAPSKFTVPFKVFTYFLKKAVEFDLTPQEIGNLALRRHKESSYHLQERVNRVRVNRVDLPQGDDLFVKAAQANIEIGLKEYAKKVKGLRVYPKQKPKTKKKK